MDAERLVKISSDNIPAGRKSPGRQKRRWGDLILDYNRRNRLQQRRRRRIRRRRRRRKSLKLSLPVQEIW